MTPLIDDKEHTKRFLVMKKTESCQFESVNDSSTPLTRFEAESVVDKLTHEDSSIQYFIIPMVLDIEGGGLDFP